jgi:hypothetical protein
LKLENYHPKIKISVAYRWGRSAGKRKDKNEKDTRYELRIKRA